MTRKTGARFTASDLVALTSRMYLRHLPRVTVPAALIFVPLGLLEEGASAATADWPSRSVGGLLAALAVSLGLSGVALLAEVSYSGVLEYTIGDSLAGRPPAPIRDLLLRLPYARLVAVQLLVAAVAVVGFILLVVPGLVALVVFSLVGPVVVLEGRRPLAALRRSAALVRTRWLLTAAIVVLPSVLGDGLDAAAGDLFGHSRTVTVAVDVVLALTIVAWEGLAIAVLAHLLMEQAEAR
jgi:hypothetical protein